MPRPIPTTVCHFTHLEHLATIVEHGLLSDTRAQNDGHLTSEAGEPRIKARRSRQHVTAGPGGVVADYVPFYFRSRSPMLFSIQRGNVPSFSGDAHDLVYLITSVEDLLRQELTLVYTDRNAALAVSSHSDHLDDLDELIDWEVMDSPYWANTDEDPDRKERRMAECLVHGRVPWTAFTSIAVFDKARERRVREILDSLEGPHPPVRVVPRAYF